MHKRFVAALSLTAITTATFGVTQSAPAHAASVTIQVLGINDFHGRLLPNTNATPDEVGAAKLAGVVDQLETTYPNSVFAAAGDLIGASTFESFIAHDKPTIDALNAAGLDVSAVGNHELDQGYDDLVDRVMAPYDPVTNEFGGAEWEYLGANVRNSSDSSPALPETWIETFGDVEVGFVGAVTDHLDELVSPAGIADLTIESPVVAANRSADALKAQGADVVVLLVHEGAATTALSSATDPNSDFGKIVNGVNDNVDAIVSGHTHLAYNHSIPVPGWAGRPVAARPVVSAGQYGMYLNQLLFSVDDATGQVTGITSNLVQLEGHPAPADPAVTAIVDAAEDAAETLGNVELGKLAGPFDRGQNLAGDENRGAESTLGNLVAEVQQTATEAPEFGGAEIAFMNPGGLRDDMRGEGPPYAAALTYRQAALVQPFANTLVNMQLTGADIKQVLEQQWQPTGAARAFLRLGISEGFTYTYDPTLPAGSRITGMYLDGDEIVLSDSFSVTVNSFLAAGGDNFAGFTNGTARRDTGQVDLQAMVDYMGNYDVDPLEVDYVQRSVGVRFKQSTHANGIAFDVSSWSMTNPDDVKDTEIEVYAGDTLLGAAPVDSTLTADLTDESGKASVDLEIPDDLDALFPITIKGTNTGSEAIVLDDGFEATTPTRLLDTRPGETTADGEQAAIGPVGPAGTIKLEVGGRGGVPAGAVGSVALNITLTQATEPTYLTAYPTGAPLPDASNLNVLHDQTVPNMVIVPVGPDGTVSLFNKYGNVHVIADLLGWIPAGDPFTGVTPARLLETRSQFTTVDGKQAKTGPIGPNGEVTVEVAGRGGVPEDAGVVVLNVTAAAATQPTFFTVYPSDQPRSIASNVNTFPGDVRPSMVIVPLSAGGDVTIYNAHGTADIVVDVLGWAPQGSTFNGLNPARLVDTRPGEATTDGKQAAGGTIGADGSLTIEVAGRGGVPADAKSVALNVIAVQGTAPSFFTVYPTGAPLPLGSNLNIKPGDIRPNMVMVPIGADGTVTLYNLDGNVHTVVDVLGWMT